MMEYKYKYNKWIEVGTYKNRHKLPELPGVYIIYFQKLFDEIKTIKYIGRSNNLHKRFTCHRVYSSLFDIDQLALRVKIKYTNNHKELERKLIQKLRPPLNKFFNWNINE